MPESKTKKRRISGVKASRERYIQLHEFLLFDPRYRGMKDKAKILYAFLRKKTQYFREQTEQAENGMKGTKSYRDAEGDIFCVSDNSELSIVLQCHINRVGDFTKELIKFGLLDIEKTFRKAHRLYILDPEELSDSWQYINEANKKREEVQKENQEKAKKYKESQKSNADEEIDDSEGVNNSQGSESEEDGGKSSNSSNSQNVSYNNSQNVSYYNSQNVRHIKLKGFILIKKNSYVFKRKNLSIYNKVKNINIASPIENVLLKQIDRLKSDYLPVVEIKFNSYKDQIDDHKFADILNTVLSHNIKSSFSNYLDRSLNAYLENRSKFEQAPNQPIRTEKLPEGYDQPDESGIDYDEMSREELLNAKETFVALSREIPEELKAALDRIVPSWKLEKIVGYKEIPDSIDKLSPKEREEYLRQEAELDKILENL